MVPETPRAGARARGASPARDAGCRCAQRRARADARCRDRALPPAPGTATRAVPAADDHPRADLWRRALGLIRDQVRSASELSLMLLRMSRRQNNPGGGIYSALEAPHTCFNAAVSTQRRVATQLFSLAQFRRMSAALRRYLIEHDALPETTLVASIPVGLPRPDGAPGNTVTGFVCPLATTEPSPKKRLELIHQVTHRTKEQLRSLSGTALDQLALLGLSPRRGTGGPVSRIRAVRRSRLERHDHRLRGSAGARSGRLQSRGASPAAHPAPVYIEIDPLRKSVLPSRALTSTGWPACASRRASFSTPAMSPAERITRPAAPSPAAARW